MDLDSEQKRRIEEEERYRAELRARLASQQEDTAASALLPGRIDKRAGDSLADRFLFIGGITVVICVVILLVGHFSDGKKDEAGARTAHAFSGPTLRPPRYITVTDILTSGQLAVRAGSATYALSGNTRNPEGMQSGR